ncbi:MAG TPA: 1,2-phenylacetyl-CoA epoxidase subunit PaaD [Jiangellaceae bacterium]|nr:1,2-phenylacetyl-CoA epoxidase subunit PaaD [Jiangellaceae bacterium]
MTTHVPTAAEVREVVAAVPDPELPVITIADLGVLREVTVREDGHVLVEITPTYSGCPAMDAIRADILDRLRERGWTDAEVRLVLAPAWTTDWITPAGREALREFGIAPPGPRGGAVPLTLTVRCPRCGSPDTREVSRFGSTACKSLWTCRACLEPFDYVKAL